MSGVIIPSNHGIADVDTRRTGEIDGMSRWLALGRSGQLVTQLVPSVDRLIKRPLPDILYHYTTPAGALGIVQSKSIWATNVHYMNDAQEFGHAIGTAIRLIDELRAAQPHRDRLWGRLTRRLKEIRLTNIHVFSLTAAGDQLSQWRAYCRGGGFSLGFSASELAQNMRGQGFFLAPCVYDPEQQESLLSDCLSFILGPYAVEAGTDPNAALHKAVESFQLHLSLVGPLLKHPSFSEENEWRLVVAAHAVLQ